MDLIKPINIKVEKLSPEQPLTSVEMGKLWVTYVGNSMTKGILQYFLKNVKDEDIKVLLENGLRLIVNFMGTVEDIFTKENFPIPIGFTEKDVNLEAPRLFEDEFYVHYLKYTAKAGMSIYSVAIPLVMRDDIRQFFIHCNTCTTSLIGQINNVLMGKGYIIKPPELPIPEKVDFVKKQKFLNGFIGDVRSLHALEVTHLYDNMENNITSKALLIAFSQVAGKDKIREFMERGKQITDRAVINFEEKLHQDNLPSPSLIDHLVTPSTDSPFSDKLMLFHKVDMFSIKIRNMGNSMAVNGRRDIGTMYLKSLSDFALFVEDGGNILIENGWMEQPPTAIDREKLTSK
ncbi:MAG: DUF3231 family protein [Bacillota bacterium]